MKLGLTLILVLSASVCVLSQSGRIKPVESPTPRPTMRPSVLYGPPADLKTPLPKAQVQAEKPDSDDDVYEVESALVPIPVSAVDEHGAAITNLTLKDFELNIDGEPAEISDVSRSETPIRLAMLFDNSSSVMLAREFEKKAAVRFFRNVLNPGRDLAALFSVADHTRLEQPLTRDTGQLVSAIEMFPAPSGATALLDGIIKTAEYLQGTDGRRVLVIVSDGEDTISDINTTLDKVLRSLQLANVQVYVVKTKDFENFKRTGQRAGNANIRTLEAERRMLEITKQTGGTVYSPIDERELDAAFRRISTELSQQYILSYYPESAGARPGQFRNISLKVKDRDNIDVRTRKGYFEPKRK